MLRIKQHALRASHCRILMHPINYAMPIFTSVRYSISTQRALSRFGASVRTLQSHVTSTHDTMAEIIDAMLDMPRVCLESRGSGYALALYQP